MLSTTWACGSSGSAPASGPPNASDPLEALAGDEWVLWETLEDGRQRPHDPEVTLTLAEGRLTGNAGCNRYFADVRAGSAPGSLEVGLAGSTKMLCPPPIMETEDRFLADLHAAVAWRRDGDRLELEVRRDDGQITLSFRARAVAAEGVERRAPGR
jgi:heat shock protein HslJ